MKQIPKRFEKFEAMIVKVQIPLATNSKEALALVYNKDRSYEVFMEITDELLKSMGREYKKFFYAHYDRKNNLTVLDREALWQEW